MAKSSKTSRAERRQYPTEAEIRRALIDRAVAHCAATRMSKTALCKAAVNDPAFLTQVEQGRNFTMELYRRFMAWLDANAPHAHHSGPKRKSA